MKILELILLTTITVNIYSCAKHPEIPTGEFEQQTYNGEPEQQTYTGEPEQKIYTGEPEQKAARTLIIDGEEIKDVTHGEFISWKCRGYFDGGKTLVEVGRVLIPDDYIHSDDYKEMDDATKEQLDEFVGMIGFILYDGTNTGDGAFYKRRGLNHRWDWGPEGIYSFIIKPDGAGLFYDFSTADNGVKENADDIYKCSR